MLEKDLRNVRRVVSDAGKVAYSAGRASGHSDATSALVFALWAARDMPLTFSRPAGYSPRSVFC